MDEIDIRQRARAFLAPLDLRAIKTDLAVYVLAANAILRKEELGVGEAGMTITRPDGKHVITVNSLEGKQRQRYTICHEIAHIVLGLPSRHDEVPLWSYAKRDPHEIACDAFASELLMPYKLWLEIVPEGLPSREVIEHMAAEFECSFHAAASRYATLASIPCALITMEKGVVRHMARSTVLRRIKAWVAPRSPIPDGSIAHRLRNDGESQIRSDTVAQDIWFQDWETGLELTELCRHHHSSDTTISLLWFEEEDLPTREVDRFGRVVEEDDGLEELDGELPWPGKRIRR